MLHIINEGGNSTLIRRRSKAPLGKDIKKHLYNVFNNYKGDKGSKGYQRLCNILRMDRDEGGINYNELTQLSHVMNKILPKSEEFATLGGDLMKAWVEISLKSMENNDRADKMARKNAGETNAFRKPHTKDRQTKPKKKPTIGKFQTKDTHKAIGNNNFIQMRENKTIIISEAQEQEIHRPILYTALCLDEKSSAMLKEFTSEYINEIWGNDEFKLLCHHSTIEFAPKDNSETLEWAFDNEGKTFPLTIEGLGFSDKAIAIQIDSQTPTTNKIKHITLAVNISNGGKPVDSNFITNWENSPLDGQILNGTVTIFYKN